MQMVQCLMLVSNKLNIFHISCTIFMMNCFEKIWIAHLTSSLKYCWLLMFMVKEVKISSCSWWHHQMGIFSMYLAICEGNPPVSGGFPSQRPVTWSFDAFFDLCLYKWLSKQSGLLRCHDTHYDVIVINRMAGDVLGTPWWYWSNLPGVSRRI